MFIAALQQMSVSQMARFIGSRAKVLSKYNTFILNEHGKKIPFIQRQIIQYNFSL